MTTPNRGYPYPALTDQPNEPTQMQALAVAVDTDMAQLFSAGWVTLTGYASGYKAYNAISGGFGYTPAYRLYGDGRVEVRGIIGINSGTFATSTAITIFASLPSAIQPAQQVHGAAAMTLSGTGGIAARVSVSGSALLLTFPSGSAATWASLDGFKYWVT